MSNSDNTINATTEPTKEPDNGEPSLEELHREKLKLEIAQLQRPFVLQQGILLTLATFLIGAGLGCTVFMFADYNDSRLRLDQAIKQETHLAQAQEELSEKNEALLKAYDETFAALQRAKEELERRLNSSSNAE